MKVYDFEGLEKHVGHKLIVIRQGEENVSIVCEDCDEILMSYQKEYMYELVCLLFAKDMDDLEEKFKEEIAQPLINGTKSLTQLMRVEKAI